MIPMKKDYFQEMKDKKIPGIPETLYNLEHREYRENDAWNYYVHDVLSGHMYGSMILLYALKSYPHPVDNSKYGLYFVTHEGIFMCCNIRSEKREPIEFRDITAKFISPFGPRDMITLHPDTRKLLLLKNVRYTEVINDKAYPNNFDTSKLLVDHHKPHSHYIILESDTHAPIKTRYEKSIITSMRYNRPYIWVRSDNYVELSNLRFWHQNF